MPRRRESYAESTLMVSRFRRRVVEGDPNLWLAYAEYNFKLCSHHLQRALSVYVLAFWPGAWEYHRQGDGQGGESVLSVMYIISIC